VSEHDVCELIPDEQMNQIGRALKMCNQVMSVPIDSDMSYAGAGQSLRNLRNLRKRLEEDRKALTAEYAEPKKVIDEHYKPVIEVLVSLESVFAHDLGEYYGKRLRQLARREESELTRADRRREQLESRADAELEKADKYQIQQRHGMADKALARAAAAQEEADYLVAAYEQVPRPAGVTFSERWGMKVSSKDDLVAFCMSSPELRKAIQIDEKHLLDLQRRAHGNMMIEGASFHRVYTPIVEGDNAE